MDIRSHALQYRLLSQIREEFDKLRWQSRPIKAQINFRATNAEAEGVKGLPSIGPNFGGMHGAGYKPGGPRRDQDGKIRYVDNPTVDVAGVPIMNSAGQAIDYEMPSHRSIQFAGRNEDCGMLATIALRAGRVLNSLDKIPSVGDFNEWNYNSENELWWSYVFEVAWSNTHPLLKAEKRLWLPGENANIYLPYDLQQIISLSTEPMLAGKIPENWKKRLPEAWVSEMSDVVSASIDTMDYVLATLDKQTTSTITSPDSIQPTSTTSGDSFKDGGAQMATIRRRFAIALSFPGEHRDTVQKTAIALKNVFGESRIFYDNFHKTDLSRPNLDLYLQSIYRDESDLVVVIVCSKYDEKEWCGVEWRAIRELMKSKKRNDEDIMFLRIDNGDVQGLLSLDGYIDIKDMKPREIADHVLRRWSSMR